nr:uncharacterized protein LOC129272412 [Lytechinus pictus]
MTLVSDVCVWGGMGCVAENDFSQRRGVFVGGNGMYSKDDVSQRLWGDNEPHIDGSTSPAAVVLNAREGKMFDSNPVESYYSVCHKLIVPGSSSKSISLRFHRVFQNFILKGHSIHVTSHSYSIPACSALCLDTTECVSINIRADGTCELNSMDWRLGENGVVEREFGAQYYEPIYHT